MKIDCYPFMGAARRRSTLFWAGLLFLSTACKSQPTSFSIVDAQTLTLSSANLAQVLIGESTDLSVSGSVDGTTLAAGDCIKVTYPQPYVNSKTIFANDAEFYVPFPSTVVPTLSASASPAATVAAGDDEFEVVITLTEAGTTSFSYTVSGFKNPYSKVANTEVNINHYAACGTTPTPCANGEATNCKTGTFFEFEIPPISTYTAPTMTITDSAEGDNNLVGSSDGYVVMEFDHHDIFPVYGGMLQLALPTWYSTSTYVLDTPEACSSTDLDITYSARQLGDYKIFFSSYTPNAENKITIKCRYYRNPIFRTVVSGFSLIIYDREDNQGLIAQYDTWSLDLSADAALNTQTLSSQMTFKVYMGSEDDSSSQVPVQTNIGLSVEFSMPIPVDDTGCYMRVEFPSDFPLSDYSANIIFQGYGILSNKQGDSNIASADIYKAFDDTGANFVVIKGCQYSGNVGDGKLVKFKVTNILSPKAKKTTEDFKIDLYKSFDTENYQLSNHLLTASQAAQETLFKDGELSGLTFSSSLKFVQTSATHSIQFTLKNALPANDATYISRIIVKMPDKMEAGTDTPTVTNIDGSLTLPVISRNTDLDGCGARPCYAISHSNSKDVAGGTSIRLQISGTINQETASDAGFFYVQTQICEKATPTNCYNIDALNSESNFVTTVGGISLTSNKRTTSSNSVTYFGEATYTLYFDLNAYIPFGGYLVLELPRQIQLKEWDNSAFSAPDGLEKDSTELNSIKLRNSGSKIVAGSYTLKFGKVTNPRSVFDSDIFKMFTYDSSMTPIAEGQLDNIKMETPGPFTSLTIQRDNETNGLLSNYTVSFIADIPVYAGDIFYLNLPDSIDPPKEPECSVGLCLDTLSCTSERGRVVVEFNTLKTNCNNTQGAEFSFIIYNITNAPSMVESAVIGASWKTSLYQNVSDYSGSATISNVYPGTIVSDEISLSQSSEDFEANSMYTIRFSPKNPIPKIGWVKIYYPPTVGLVNDGTDFANNCSAIVTASYSGADHCMLDADTRSIWFYNIFKDQDQFTSEISLSFELINPVNNFADPSAEGSSFNVTTYDFDLVRDFPEVLSTDYSDDSITDFLTKVKADPYEYVKPIDNYTEPDLLPKLKCNYPCLTCQDSNADYCTSCWGSSGKEFLQYEMETGSQTCKAYCDDGYTTNGNDIEGTKGLYHECESCDMTCRICQGQGKEAGDVGVEGSKLNCTACSNSFDYIVHEEKKCYALCAAGYFYEKQPFKPEDGVCGICQYPCQTCEACTEGDPLCDKAGSGYLTFADKSAHFCTACNQDIFFPDELDFIEDIKMYVEHQAGMANRKPISLSATQIEYINGDSLKGYTFIEFRNEKVLALEGTAIYNELGMVKPDTSIIDVSDDTTFGELYDAQYSSYDFPRSSLHNKDCIAFCPDGFASVNGKCLPCQSPCENCKKDVNKCTSCLQNQSQKYVFGSQCFEICPESTITDEENKRCLGCISGCLVCDKDDQEICYDCKDPLLLHEQKCLGACPDGFRPSFDGKTCEMEGDIPVIYFPLLILTVLAMAISIGGEYSSKNVFGQHRKLLSFYAMVGVIDAIALWAQLVLTFLQGQYWQLGVPGFALLINYYLNFRFIRLWNVIDPPKPKEEDQLTLEEVKLINQCDENFDKWNGKYFNVANQVRRLTAWLSHKFFHFPFSHFYGYLHFTVRIQDHYVIWQWDTNEVIRFNQKRISMKRLTNPDFKYKGRLAPQAQNSYMQEMLKDDKNFEAYEGGDKEFSPFDYVQHPASFPKRESQKIPDTRVHDLFKHQLKVDIVLIRLVVILGNVYLIYSDFGSRSIFQLMIEAIECIVLSFILIILQMRVASKWEEYKLPLKMKDTKANYLFRTLKPPNLDNKDWGEAPDDVMPEWNKYMHFYKFNEVFLDNKLEELLGIFGRRQCKSCIEFPTGTEIEQDPRNNRSWPLSPKGERLYEGMAGDFSLIDFLLPDNVYHEAQEPTQMFESVARDYSNFGAQVFAFDVMEALNRKGGDLLTPGIDEEFARKKLNKRARGRQNKYSQQIDLEDNEEAKNISDSENEGLGNVKEEDDEDDAADELLKKRIEEERKQKASKQIADLEKKKKLEAEKKAREAAEKERREEQERAKAQAAASKKTDELRASRESARLKEEEERKVLAEAEARKKAEVDRERADHLAKEKEMKEEEDKIAREQAVRDMKAQAAQEKAAAEAKKKEQQQKDEEEALKQEIIEKHTPKKAAPAKSTKNQGETPAAPPQVEETPGKPMTAASVEAPPRVESRGFNECDILGDFDRDEKGNVIVGEPDEQGRYFDKNGRQTNKRGYLINPRTGDVVNNLDGGKMFTPDQLDDKGEVPAPFNVEKHNFNGHETRGHFDFDKSGRPVIQKAGQGAFADKRGSRVSSRGYLVDANGNMVDHHGRVKFDNTQMTREGDLPKLYNYNGRRFDITDTLGQVDKDSTGRIIPKKDAQGRLVDNLGRRINSKGYLIDEFGNVIDKDGRQIFEKSHLENDEIPKIFPFTKFNVKNITGDFEMDPLGNPILDRDSTGALIDRQGRRVNAKGYLIDKNGNIINIHGKPVFKKEILDNEGDIPKVYRTGLLKADTASSLSRLMSEIEKNQPSEFDQEERRIQEEIENQIRRPRGHSGNTSVDSMMEDTPANYNMQNQRFDADMDTGGVPPDEDEDEYGSQYEQIGGHGPLSGNEGQGHELAAKKKKKKKKKKKRQKPVEYEDPSLREQVMAAAYGGEAKRKPKRQGVKYTTDLDSGLREIATPGSAFIRDPSRKNVSYSGFANVQGGAESSRGGGRRQYGTKLRSSAGKSELGSAIGSKLGSTKNRPFGGEATSKLLDPQQREAQLKQQQMDEIKKKQARARKKKAAKVGKITKDADFENMFGKDIDEFLEDSEWDIESIDKMSQFSKGSKNTIRSATQAGKLKGLEKVYLQRIESNQKNTQQIPSSHLKPKEKKGEKFRELQDRFQDDPGYIHRGIDEDNESLNSQNRRAQGSSTRKKAWDAGSKGSSKKGIGRGLQPRR